MVSFQRMKDDLDDLGTHVSNKLPPIGRTACLVLAGAAIAVVLVVGIAIGYAANSSSSSSPLKSSRAIVADPTYVIISNGSYSCPALMGSDRLLTLMPAGQSFEGLVVSLACRGDFSPFPNQIKCRRKKGAEDSPWALEWSHVPVCYPSVLVSKEYWSKTLHARSVSCNGDSSRTRCELSCIRDFIAVESAPYECSDPPCPDWSLGDARCFMCDKKCDDMHSVKNPRSDALLSRLGCSAGCDRILVLSESGAAVWQNKRTGLFVFLGEHEGKPVYQNNATKEFLFYTDKVRHSVTVMVLFLFLHLIISGFRVACGSRFPSATRRNSNARQRR